MNPPIPRRSVGRTVRVATACPANAPRRTSNFEGIEHQRRSRSTAECASSQPGVPTLEALRQRLQALLPDYGDATLQAFVLRVFKDDGMLRAYFRSISVTEMPTIHKPVLPVRTRKCLPIEAALRAADHASALALVRPHERRLAHLAALLYPCAWFDSNRIAALSPQAGLGPSLEQTAALRAWLLEDAMRWLRAHCHGLADTLAAAIGLPHDGDINDEQVARIASAVYLANLRLCAEWAA